MAEAEACLSRLVGERRRIYGVTTGYGPLACHYVTPEFASELQHGLLRHLATGVGRPFGPRETRAIMLARLSSLAVGRSAIGADAFGLLAGCLNADLLPVVPEMGTVGASGDLTPLAHVALALTGEGEALLDGERMPAAAALARAGLAPVRLGRKEGLALVNGTSAMTGVAALNGVRARRAAALALRLSLVYAEAMGGHAEAFDPRLGEARGHGGQRRVHAAVARLVAGAPRLRPTVQPPPALPEDGAPAEGGVLADREIPQDPYTIRCIPQVFGALEDLLDFHDGQVESELNAATDNPLVFAEDGAVLHGGNFYGQPVGYASDALALGVVNLAVHAERSLARVTDVALNRGLPAFLHRGPVGLNSGFMGAQVTASALVAEMRSRAVPATIQSIPTNGNNQDVVPMGTIAARKTAGLLDLCGSVLAIHALALAQAVDLLGGPDRFSPAAARLHRWVRRLSEPLGRDRPLSPEIAAVAAALEREPWDAWG
jgi:tyrosine ammonia-lyase